MFRHAAAFAVLVAAILGCSKKTDSTSPGGEPSDPNAKYELKFPAIQKGDKHEVLKKRSATATIKTANSTQVKADEFRYEYTETIDETAADERLPTKVTRVYKTANRTDARGETKSASHVGKTITIEKYLKGHKYAVDGQSLPVQEQTEIAEDFNRGTWKLEHTFPKEAVKVGDEWNVDFAAIPALGGKAQDGYNKEKSKITGKLVRAYKKDGKQWGVIEVKIALVLDSPRAKGTSDSTVTYDIVIDGSTRSGTVKIATRLAVEGKDGLGNDVTTTVEGTDEQSLTPVK